MWAGISPSVTSIVTELRSDLHRSLSLDHLWQATQGLIRHHLPHRSCSLMLDIGDGEPARSHHTVLDALQPDYLPANSIAISRPFLAAHPRVRVYTYSQIVSEDPDARQRRIAQERHHDEWSEFVHLAFWNEARLDTVLSIRRGGNDACFTADELRFLEELYPDIDASLHRMRALEGERRRLASLDACLARLPIAAMGIDADGRGLFATSQAHRLCERWNRNLGESHQHLQLPGGIAELLDRASLRNGLWQFTHPRDTTLRVTLVRDSLGGDPQARCPSYVLSFAEQTPPALPDVGSVTTSLDRLTPRERQVALLIAEGLSNQAIAERLERSRRTIETQLGSIYRKFEVHTRTQLLRRLMRR